MKRQSARIANNNAKKLTTSRRGAPGRRSGAVVTVDPFIVKPSKRKISDYYGPAGSDQTRDGDETYSCKWQIGRGFDRICDGNFSSSTNLIEHIMGKHANAMSSNFKCQWISCDGVFHCKTEFILHAGQHAESAAEITEHEDMETNSFSEESSNDNSEEDEEYVDIEDEDFIEDEKIKTKHSSKQKTKSPKKEKPKVPEKPTVPASSPSKPTTVAGKDTALITLFDLKCQWQVPHPSDPSQMVICLRRYKEVELSIDHLHHHHIAKMQGDKPPYHCCWKGCSMESNDFNTIEELNTHVIIHVEDKLRRFKRDTAGGVAKPIQPVQRLTPTIAKTSSPAPQKKPAQVGNSIATPSPQKKPTPVVRSVAKDERPVRNVRKRGRSSSSTSNSSINSGFNESEMPSDQLVSNVRPVEQVRKRGRQAKSTSISLERKEFKSSNVSQPDLGIDSESVGSGSESIVPAVSPNDSKFEKKSLQGFESFASRPMNGEENQSCINSVLQSLLTTSLTTSLVTQVKELCSIEHNCYFCRMLSFTQREIHNFEGKPINPFELLLCKADMGITHGEGDPAKYIEKLINQIVVSEKEQHGSSDTKYRFMIRFQKKSCSCSMSYEAYCWALCPSRKNERLSDLMEKSKIYCNECKVVTPIKSIQVPDNLIVPLYKETPGVSVYYPEEWVSFNTRYFLAAVIIEAIPSDMETKPHYHAYCKVFGKWMLYDDGETTESSSSSVIGNKQARVLVYVTTELTPAAVEEALLQSKSYSLQKPEGVIVKSERLDDW